MIAPSRSEALELTEKYYEPYYTEKFGFPCYVTRDGYTEDGVRIHFIKLDRQTSDYLNIVDGCVLCNAFIYLED